MLHMLSVHENLIEAYLEMNAYADVQALLVRYDGFGKNLLISCTHIDLREPKSAVLCYTSALLKARNVADKYALANNANIFLDLLSRSRRRGD